MNNKLTKDDCIKLLNDKHIELNRPLKKSDFSEDEVAVIKSFLGPWPRALEAAGLKDISQGHLLKLEKRKQKRINAKINIRENKLSKKNK